mmetsp:Transcript_40506/g.73228  ORF Transcript_40506/g.73228 Transcript_40506/m.73228 type:complete len:83 (+) Transcript_40506:1129-1377(+)
MPLLVTDQPLETSESGTLDDFSDGCPTTTTPSELFLRLPLGLGLTPPVVLLPNSSNFKIPGVRLELTWAVTCALPGVFVLWQ